MELALILIVDIVPRQSAVTQKQIVIGIIIVVVAQQSNIVVQMIVCPVRTPQVAKIMPQVALGMMMDIAKTVRYVAQAIVLLAQRLQLVLPRLTAHGLILHADQRQQLQHTHVQTIVPYVHIRNACIRVHGILVLVFALDIEPIVMQQQCVLVVIARRDVHASLMRNVNMLRKKAEASCVREKVVLLSI